MLDEVEFLRTVGDEHYCGEQNLKLGRRLTRVGVF